MDDKLGQPSFPPPQIIQEEEIGDVSGDDEDGPDWTKFKSFASSPRPFLPKRGDKEFEPALNGPTKLQTHSLNRARDAMFAALGAERAISKSVSYAVWYSDLARAHVTQARGVLFNGMGHSVPRVTPKSGKQVEGMPKVQKRTELLPEESLYLIERGSLFCWKDEPKAQLHSAGETEADTGVDEESRMRGSPMSVQQAFAEMIGREDLTLERYQAYAYLKRLGFNVLRAKPPSQFYPTPAAPIVAQSSLSSSRTHPLARFLSPFLTLLSRLRSWLFGNIDWWKPLKFGWFGCLHNYESIYRALRIIPAGHTVPLYSPPSFPHSPLNTESTKPSTPYEIFFHIYKPNTPFRKTAPPSPDYSLVVINARTTPLPTIHELTYLWSFLPETGPPLPRTRNPKASISNPPDTPRPTTQPQLTSSPPRTFFARLFAWLIFPVTALGKTAGEEAPTPKKPHPFAVLKGGKKTVVIGIVDNGTVGFFRFGMGAFEEIPMV